MRNKTSFPPIETRHAKLLILGSMPSEKSLQQQQYYAHPRNAFWFIIQQLLRVEKKLNYSQKRALLHQHHIALWDVLKSCQRQGSLDSAIINRSIQVNNFETFLNQHSSIKAIFFNGAKAEQEYLRRVLPNLTKNFDTIHYQRLPSSSPAMATLTPTEKLSAWSSLVDCLL